MQEKSPKVFAVLSRERYIPFDIAQGIRRIESGFRLSLSGLLRSEEKLVVAVRADYEVSDQPTTDIVRTNNNIPRLTALSVLP